MIKQSASYLSIESSATCLDRILGQQQKLAKEYVLISLKCNFKICSAIYIVQSVFSKLKIFH